MKRILALFVLLLGLASAPVQAAISFTNIGQGVGSPFIFNPLVNVPAGATIIIGVLDVSGNSLTGTVTDTAGNIYTKITTTAVPTQNWGVSMFYSANVSALTTAGSITVTGSIPADSAYATAMYATGLTTTPFDVSAVGSGSAGAVTLTSPAPSQGGDLFVSIAGGNSNPPFTQAAGWSNSPGGAGNSSWISGQGIGGSLVAAGGGAQTWTPSAPGAFNWAGVIAGFKSATPPSAGGPSLSLLGVGH